MAPRTSPDPPLTTQDPEVTREHRPWGHPSLAAVISVPETGLLLSDSVLAEPSPGSGLS